MAEFFHMGGYAVYVWSSYGLAFVVLGANIVAARIKRKRTEQQLLRRLRSEDK